MKILALALAFPLASAFVSPIRSAAVPKLFRPSPVKADGGGGLVGAVAPSNADQTLRNAFGYQMIGWGAGGLVAPMWMMTTLFGVNGLSLADTALLRGMSVVNLLLGAQVCRGDDANAAADGFIFFGAWYKILQCAIAKAGFGAFTPQIATFNLLMFLVAARRSGGLFNKLTQFDTDSLSRVLPSKAAFSNFLDKKNLVGLQLFGWGACALFFSDFMLGPKLLGVSHGAAVRGVAVTSAVTAITLKGLGLGNLLLAGRTLNGSNEQAGATGTIMFGTWAALGFVGFSAGYFTGELAAACALWNAVVAAYCLLFEFN